MKNKKITLILIIILLVLLCIVIYLLKPSENSNVNLNINNTSNLNSEVNNNTVNIEASATLVNDYDVYFSINSILSTVYENISFEEYDKVLNVLNSTYISVNKIDANNVKNYMSKKYDQVYFYPKDIYVKANNNYKFYFVSGLEMDYDFIDEKLYLGSDKNYLLIVKGNHYELMPLANNITNLYEYAQKYNTDINMTIKSNSDNKYEVDDYSDEYIARYYISYYQELLYLNPEKAYTMNKNGYLNYEQFALDINNIYENISGKVFSYTVSGSPGRRTYKVILYTDYKVILTEERIMEFTVKIEDAY